MNWDAVSALAEIIGVVVVVISLLYVAIQIRQNTEAMQAASAQDLVTVSTNAHFLIASDSALAEIIQKAFQERELLAPREQLQFNAHFLGLYIQYDFAYRQYLKGRVEPDTWDRMELEMTIFASLPAGAAWWAQDKVRFSPQFVSYLDDKLDGFVPPETIPTIGKSDAGTAT